MLKNAAMVLALLAGCRTNCESDFSLDLMVDCSNLSSHASPIAPNLNSTQRSQTGWLDVPELLAPNQLEGTRLNPEKMRTWRAKDGRICQEFDRQLLACEPPAGLATKACAIRSGTTIRYVTANPPKHDRCNTELKQQRNMFPHVDGWDLP